MFMVDTGCIIQPALLTRRENQYQGCQGCKKKIILFGLTLHHPRRFFAPSHPLAKRWWYEHNSDCRDCYRPSRSKQSKLLIWRYSCKPHFKKLTSSSKLLTQKAKHQKNLIMFIDYCQSLLLLCKNENHYVYNNWVFFFAYTAKS